MTPLGDLDHPRSTFFRSVGYTPWDPWQTFFHVACGLFRFVHHGSGARAGKSKQAGAENAYEALHPSSQLWLAGETFEATEKEFGYAIELLSNLRPSPSGDPVSVLGYARKETTPAGGPEFRLPNGSWAESKSDHHQDSMLSQELNLLTLCEGSRISRSAWTNKLNYRISTPRVGGAAPVPRRLAFQEALAEDRTWHQPGRVIVPTTGAGFNWLVDEFFVKAGGEDVLGFEACGWACRIWADPQKTGRPVPFTFGQTRAEMFRFLVDPAEAARLAELYEDPRYLGPLADGSFDLSGPPSSGKRTPWREAFPHLLTQREGAREMREVGDLPTGEGLSDFSPLPRGSGAPWEVGAPLACPVPPFYPAPEVFELLSAPNGWENSYFTMVTPAYDSAWYAWAEYLRHMRDDEPYDKLEQLVGWFVQRTGLVLSGVKRRVNRVTREHIFRTHGWWRTPPREWEIYVGCDFGQSSLSATVETAVHPSRHVAVTYGEWAAPGGRIQEQMNALFGLPLSYIGGPLLSTASSTAPSGPLSSPGPPPLDPEREGPARRILESYLPDSPSRPATFVVDRSAPYAEYNHALDVAFRAAAEAYGYCGGLLGSFELVFPTQPAFLKSRSNPGEKKTLYDNANALCRRRQLVIIEDQCPELCKEIERLVFKEDSTKVDSNERDEVRKRDDHRIDAWLYELAELYDTMAEAPPYPVRYAGRGGETPAEASFRKIREEAHQADFPTEVEDDLMSYLDGGL